MSPPICFVVQRRSPAMWSDWGPGHRIRPTSGSASPRRIIVSDDIVRLPALERRVRMPDEVSVSY